MQCQRKRLDSKGLRAPCAREAVWLYLNGDFRRAECAVHATITQSFIRYSGDPSSPRYTGDPRDPKLVPIDTQPPARPGAEAGRGEQGVGE